MKPVVTAFLALAVLAAVVIVTPISKHTVRPVYARSVCTNETLTGNYAVSLNGFQIQASGPVPFFGEGLGTFDGKGNFSANLTFSLNGTAVTGTGSSPYGTYTVHPDCTGLVTATPGSGGDDLAFVIIGRGAEIFATDISTPDTLNVHFKKQSRGDDDDGSGR